MKKMLLFLLFFININCYGLEAYDENVIKVSYSSHVQSIGWQEEKHDGELSGTTGIKKRIEAIKIKISKDFKGSIEYKSYIEGIGWEDKYRSDGEVSGTTGQSKKIEALKIKLTSDVSEEYDVLYRVHVQSLGWLGWAKNDEVAGTYDYNYRIEGLEVKIINKGEELKNSDKPSYYKKNIKYQAHVQSIGWQNTKYDGEYSGVKDKRVEAFKVLLGKGYDGNVEYSSLVQDSGWGEYKKNGEISGTTGQAKRIEAIKIRLSGEVSKQHDIYYRVYIQNLGYLGWAKNDEIAGTSDYNYKIEGIEIKLLKKDEEINDNIPPFSKPNIIYQSHVQSIGWQDNKYDGELSGTIDLFKRVEAIKVKLNSEIDGNIEYSSLIQDSGWGEYKKNGEISGTTGQAKRIEAIKIRLSGEVSKQYDIYYRVYVQRLGYLGWAKNDEIAGTIGYSYRIEALEIKMLKKSEIIKDEKPSYYRKNIKYNVYKENEWQEEKYDGETSGNTTDKGIKAIKIKIINNEYSGSVIYKSLISDFGFERDYKKDDQISGVLNKKIEAIQVKLNGDISSYFDIYYRVLIDNYGWLGWAKNGEFAGTSGYGYEIKSLEIKIVDKDNIITSDKPAFYQTTDGYFVISSKNSNDYVISTQGNTYINNGNVISQFRNDETGQIWKLKDLNNGYYKIISAVNPSLTMGVCNSEYKNGVNVCLNNEDNLWKLNDLNDGYFTISSENNYLTVSNNNLIASEYKNLDNQKFKFISFTGKKTYKGIDISKWQGNINWSLLSLDSPEFIIMRVGTGRNNYEKDSKFEEYYYNAKKYNIPVGAYTYSFATNLNETKKEANLTLDWLSGKNLDLPVFYDIENINQTLLGKDVLTMIAKTFCKIIMDHGYKCGIYANKYFLKDNLDAEELAKNYPIWLAHWTGSNSYDEAISNEFKSDYNITPYKYWQFSSLGSYRGIDENTVDLDFGYDIFD